MATQRTRGTSTTGGNNDSVIEQSAHAVSEIIESGAAVMGRGLAAGVEGMAQLADRAAEMTGITSPHSVGRAAESAARSTATAARSAARTAQRAARTTTRAAKRAGSTTARGAKRSARTTLKASSQKSRRKVSRSKSTQSKRSAKSGRKRA